MRPAKSITLDWIPQDISMLNAVSISSTGMFVSFILIMLLMILAMYLVPDIALYLAFNL